MEALLWAREVPAGHGIIVSEMDSSATRSGSGKLQQKHLTWLILALILGWAALLRLAWLSYEGLWYDELYVVWARKLPLDRLIPEILASEHPPLFNIAGVFWGSIDQNEFWARLPSALIGVVTVLLTFLTAREFFTRRTGLWAAAFAACSPLLVWYSRDATSYSWVIALSLASLYLLGRSCLRGGWKNWAAYTAVTLVAVYSHFSSEILLAAEAVLFVVLARKAGDSRRPMLYSQAFLWGALAALILASSRYFGDMQPANPLSFATLERLYFGMVRAPLVLLMGYADHRMGSQAAVPLLGKLKAVLLALWALALAATFFSGRVRRLFADRRMVALALFGLIMVAGPVALLMLRSLETTGRYYAWAAPAVFIVMAVVVARAPRRVGAIAGACIIAGLTLTTVYETGIRHNEDFRGIMAVVDAGRREGDVLMCFPEHIGVVAADFYLMDNIDVVGGFMDPKRLDVAFFPGGGDRWSGYLDGYIEGYHERKVMEALKGEELRERLERDLSRYQRVWLLQGKDVPGQFSSAKVVEEALAPGWEAVEAHDFPLMMLKLYRRR
ncbi:MAG: hypothetical protein C4534_04135 [Gaiellales bacterium]|nr:MAG: hypothetical protein C4534_04135 [Gaiellales bacterium]